MDTIKFVCPISLEEFPLCDGILLDTKYYALHSMRTWLRRKSTVPHTRRELTMVERETISNGADFDFSDDDDEDVYFADEIQVINGSLPDERDMRSTMSWSSFERFVKNARGYFNAKEIDSLTDAVFTVLGVEIHVNIRRQYLVTNEGDCSEKFTTHLSVHGYEFCQEEVVDVHVGEAIMGSVRDYIVQWYSLIFSLISSILK